MKSKIAGIVFILGSLYYLIAEAISAFSFNDTLINTYLFYTISELGIPTGADMTGNYKVRYPF